MTETSGSAMPHTLYIDDRARLTLTGVTDVGSFNETSVNVTTPLGELTVTGENLQVTKLSLETGEVVVEGKIGAAAYTEGRRKPGGGLFAKVLG